MIAIDVARLDPQGSRYEGEEPPDIVDLEEPGDLMRPTGPLTYKLNARVVVRELLVQGSLSMPVQFRCSRCGETFTTVVREPSLWITRELTNLVDSADLTEEIREAILLAFPTYPVCLETCRGVCPHCGVNRNRESCRCQPAEDTRWSALDKLS